MCLTWRCTGLLCCKDGPDFNPLAAWSLSILRFLHFPHLLLALFLHLFHWNLNQHQLADFYFTHCQYFPIFYGLLFKVEQTACSKPPHLHPRAMFQQTARKTQINAKKDILQLTHLHLPSFPVFLFCDGCGLFFQLWVCVRSPLPCVLKSWSRNYLWPLQHKKLSVCFTFYLIYIILLT